MSNETNGISYLYGIVQPKNHKHNHNDIIYHGCNNGIHTVTLKLSKDIAHTPPSCGIICPQSVDKDITVSFKDDCVINIDNIKIYVFINMFERWLDTWQQKKN